MSNLLDGAVVVSTPIDLKHIQGRCRLKPATHFQLFQRAYFNKMAKDAEKFMFQGDVGVMKKKPKHRPRY